VETEVLQHQSSNGNVHAASQSLSLMSTLPQHQCFLAQHSFAPEATCPSCLLSFFIAGLQAPKLAYKSVGVQAVHELGSLSPYTLDLRCF